MGELQPDESRSNGRQRNESIVLGFGACALGAERGSWG
jgi:hypothetical protein